MPSYKIGVVFAVRSLDSSSRLGSKRVVVTPLADSEVVLTANFEISCDHYFGFLDLGGFRELSTFPHARSVSASKMITVACANSRFLV